MPNSSPRGPAPRRRRRRPGAVPCRAGRLAGAHVGQGAVGLGDALDQHLDLAAGGLVAVQPGLDDAGVVEDQQVAGPQQAGQVGEAPVMQLAGVIQVQQPAAAAFGGGRLGDELGRQLVVEVGNGERSGHAGIWQERAGGAGCRRGRSSWNRPGRPAGSYRAGLGQPRYCKGRPAGGRRPLPGRQSGVSVRGADHARPSGPPTQPARAVGGGGQQPAHRAPSGDRSKPPCSPRLVSAPARPRPGRPAPAR